MTVASYLWQLTGSHNLCNAVLRIENATHRAIAALSLWQERGRQRRALAALDATLLRDIGRSHHEVAQECAKPMWRA